MSLLGRLLAVWIAVVGGAGIVAAGATDREPAQVAAAVGAAASSTSAPTTTTTSAPRSGPGSSTTTGLTTTAPATPTSPPPTTATTMVAEPVAGRGAVRTSGAILLVWTSGGLPDGFAAAVTGIEQVTAHTTVSGDLIRLVATRDGDGRTVGEAPDGWAWPIDAFAVDPVSYASFQADDRDVLASLAPGEAILSASSARVRRIGVGGVLSFAGGDVTVRGVVADAHAGGAEVLVHRDDGARLGIVHPRFVLLTDTDRAAVEDAIRARTPSGTHLSLRGEADTRYLRHADRVDPQVHVKLAYGEFLFQDASGREIRIDPAWVAANIASEDVPILGAVRCHRRVLPLVRAAMQELVDAGRRDAVDPARFAGCQYARRIAPGAGLSRHSWGLALDLNIGADPRGTYESQDPALVAAMRRQGFHWGGDWEYPDPGHYEAMSPR